jgi:hypothetical protein
MFGSMPLIWLLYILRVLNRGERSQNPRGIVSEIRAKEISSMEKLWCDLIYFEKWGPKVQLLNKILSSLKGGNKSKLKLKDNDMINPSNSILRGVRDKLRELYYR